LDLSSSFALLFDPTLPAPRVNLASKSWRLQPLTLPFSPLEDPPTALHIDRNREFQFDSAMESFLLDQGFDLYHATYTFMWEAFASRRLFRTRWVATFYDLIPLRFHSEYLDPLGESGCQSFAQRLGAAVYAQRAQAISHASQIDLVDATGLPEERIDVVYGGVDPTFGPLQGADETMKRIADLTIPGPYLFSVSGFHHTKNLKRLLEAYSLLPEALRHRYHLVILCPLSQRARGIVDEWLISLGIQDKVTFLHKVTERQLVGLYNGASLLVHATLSEGFGLPILEAMRCGTPVVASNVSSMPEIAGEAAKLVDPHLPPDVAQGIEEVLESSTLRTEMRERGFLQSAKFTWERTASAVMDSYAKAVSQPLYSLRRTFPASFAQSARRLRLAYWSPLNPCPSGVSDYSELLIAELGKHADVDVFLDGYQPSNLPLFDSFPMFDARAYPHLARQRPYDLNLYQVGNNPLHRYMYDTIISCPGIITLHDIYVYHFIHAAFVLSGRVEEFWQEVAYCEGASLARKARLDYLKGKLDDYLLPLNKRLVLASRGVVAHSQWAASRIKEYEGGPPVRHIPFGIFLLEEDGGRFGRLVRRLLGLPEKGFIFGVFGNLHRVKRISVVLRAFGRVHKQHPDAALFIMGPADSSVGEDLHFLQENPSAAHAEGVYPYLTYASYDLMLMAMQAIDVGINLRYPTAGETSGTLSMLLGQGKPTIVSDVGSFTEYPDACCPKTPVNKEEEDSLFLHMMAMIENNSHYRRAVQAAYDYCRDKTWPLCAQRYLDFVEEVLRAPHLVGKR
jgi:glycosyltransferase involved in cell wall biosynthesis